MAHPQPVLNSPNDVQLALEALATPGIPESESGVIATSIMDALDRKVIDEATVNSMREGLRQRQAPAGLREELIGSAQADLDAGQVVPRAGFPRPPEETAQQVAERRLQAKARRTGLTSRAERLLTTPFAEVAFREDEAGKEKFIAERKQADDRRELDLLNHANALGIDPQSIEGSKTTGEIAAEGLAILPFMRAKSVTGRALSNAATGFALGGTRDEIGEFDVDSGLFEAGLITTFGGLLELPGFARRLFLSDAKRARQQAGVFPDDSNYFYTREGDITHIPEFLDEAVGRENVRVKAIASKIQSNRISGGTAEEETFRRAEQALSSYSQHAESLTGGASALQIIRQLGPKVDEVYKTLKGAASAEWRNIVKKATDSTGIRVAGRGQLRGGPRFIDPENFIEALGREAERMRKVTGSDKAAEFLAVKIRKLRAQGKLDASDWHETIRNIDEFGFEEGLKFNTDDFGAALRQDFEAAKVGAHPQLLAFMKGVETADKAYKNLMGEAKAFGRVFSDRVSLKALGDKPQEFATKFLKLEAAEKKLVFDALNKHAPGYARRLSGAVWKGQLEKHLKFPTAGADRSRRMVDLDGMSKDMTGMPVGDWKVMIHAPNMTAQERVFANAAWKQLNRLRGSPNKIEPLGGPDIGSKMREWVINAVSQNPGFMGRLLAGEMAPGALERWFYTEKGMRSWISLGERTTGRVTTSTLTIDQIMDTFVELSNESDLELAELQKRVNDAEQLERVGQSGAF